MMNFKFFIFSTLCLGFLTLSSCSNDDDAGPQGPTVSSQVFATWNMAFYIDNGMTVNDIPCESDIEYTFNNNGNYTKTLFSEGNSPNNCDVSLQINGTWEIVDDNVLLLKPSSSSFDDENITLILINNNQQLQIQRTNTLLEVYNRL